MEYRDYYETLGVPRTASQAEIKKTFRKLARQHHPDVKPGDKTAERRFKDINEANEVLSDPEKRAKYDALGADWERYSSAGGGTGDGARDPFGPGGPFAGFGGTRGGGAGGNVRYEFRTGDAGGFSDFFRTFFTGAEEGTRPAQGSRAENARYRAQASGGGMSFDDIVGGMGFDASGATGGSSSSGGSGGRIREGGSATRGRGSVEATAEISLEEAFHGTKRIVEVDGKRLEVNIPRGVDTGSRIRLAGRGGDGRDLYVVTKIKPHPVFTRHGPDLHRELLISLREALLGGEVPVATLRGKVLLTIPAGTQTGRVFRLKGQGMTRLKGDGDGDLYAKVRVVIPTKLSPESEAAAGNFLDLVDQPDPRATTP